jgi:hypothetical protein
MLHPDLTSGQSTSMTNTYCCVYSVETPDEGQQICLKHLEFFTKINLRNSASRPLLQEYITLHGPLIVKRNIMLLHVQHIPASVCYTFVQCVLTVLTWRMMQQACLQHRYQTALRHFTYNCSPNYSCHKSLQPHGMLCSHAVHSMLGGKVMIRVQAELALPVSH